MRYDRAGVALLEHGRHPCAPLAARFDTVIFVSLVRAEETSVRGTPPGGEWHTRAYEIFIGKSAVCFEGTPACCRAPRSIFLVANFRESRQRNMFGGWGLLFSRPGRTIGSKQIFDLQGYSWEKHVRAASIDCQAAPAELLRPSRASTTLRARTRPCAIAGMACALPSCEDFRITKP